MDFIIQMHCIKSVKKYDETNVEEVSETPPNDDIIDTNQYIAAN